MELLGQRVDVLVVFVDSAKLSSMRSSAIMRSLGEVEGNKNRILSICLSDYALKGSRSILTKILIVVFFSE